MTFFLKPVLSIKKERHFIKNAESIATEEVGEKNSVLGERRNGVVITCRENVSMGLSFSS